jgi:hypothetical protein
VNSTCTKAVNFRDLQERGEAAAILVRLMMAANDLALSNECLDLFSREQSPFRKHRQMGARIYFLNLQLGHLSEAMDVVHEIKSCEDLLDLVGRCDSRTREAFDLLQRYLPGGTERAEFERYVIQIRNNLVFHYEKAGKLIKRAIADRASRVDGRMSSITRGSNAYLWRFNAADDLMDSIVCRQIWRVPRTANDRAEVDRVAGYVFQIYLTFLDFVGEFVWEFFSS